MVTSIPFYSFKDFNFRRSVPFWAVLLVVVGVAAGVAISRRWCCFCCFARTPYPGYVIWLWNFRKARSPF